MAAGRQQLPAVVPLVWGALRALPGHSCAARSFAALPALPHTFRMRFRTPLCLPLHSYVTGRPVPPLLLPTVYVVSWVLL